MYTKYSCKCGTCVTCFEFYSKHLEANAGLIENEIYCPICQIRPVVVYANVINNAIMPDITKYSQGQKNSVVYQCKNKDCSIIFKVYGGIYYNSVNKHTNCCPLCGPDRFLPDLSLAGLNRLINKGKLIEMIGYSKPIVEDIVGVDLLSIYESCIKNRRVGRKLLKA